MDGAGGKLAQWGYVTNGATPTRFISFHGQQQLNVATLPWSSNTLLGIANKMHPKEIEAINTTLWSTDIYNQDFYNIMLEATILS